MGNSKVSVAYEIDSVDGDIIVTKSTIDGEEVKLSFKLLGMDMMMFSSDATDDMDFYIWKREVVHKV